MERCPSEEPGIGGTTRRQRGTTGYTLLQMEGESPASVSVMLQLPPADDEFSPIRARRSPRVGEACSRCLHEAQETVGFDPRRTGQSVDRNAAHVQREQDGRHVGACRAPEEPCEGQCDQRPLPDGRDRSFQRFLQRWGRDPPCPAW